MFNLAGLLCHGNSLHLTRGFSAHLSWITSPSVLLASAEMVESGHQPGRAPPKAHSTKAAKGKGQGTSTLLRAPPKWHTFLPFHSHGPGFPGKPTPSCQRGGRCTVAGQPELLRENLSRFSHEPLVSVPSTRRSCLNHKRWLGPPMACAYRLQPEHPAKIRPRVAGSRFRKAPRWPKGRCWNWPKRPVGPCGRSHQVHP